MPRVPIVGVGAVVWHDDRLLLIRRSKPPRAGQWSLPGGRQEFGETVEEAVRRELLEETAVTCGPLTFLAIIDFLERDEHGAIAEHYTLIDYAAEALHDKALAGSDAAAVAWWRVSDLEELTLWESTRDVIARATELRGGNLRA